MLRGRRWPACTGCWPGWTIISWTRPFRSWAPLSAWRTRTGASGASPWWGCAAPARPPRLAMAAERGVPFVELDREIEREAGTSMAEILLLHGQAGYAATSAARCCASLRSMPDGVVMTTGGSIVSERETFDLLQSHFYCVVGQGEPRGTHEPRGGAGRLRPFKAARSEDGEMRPRAMNDALEDLRRILASRESLSRAPTRWSTPPRAASSNPSKTWSAPSRPPSPPPWRPDERRTAARRRLPPPLGGGGGAARSAEPGGGYPMNAMTEPLCSGRCWRRGTRELVSFATHPSRYRHWKLAVEGRGGAPEARHRTRTAASGPATNSS